MISVKRWLSELPPDWPEAWIALIDALRGYIAADQDVAEDFLREGSITREEYDKSQRHLEPLRALLNDLERHEICPHLHGIRAVPERRQP